MSKKAVPSCAHRGLCDFFVIYNSASQPSFFTLPGLFKTPPSSSRGGWQEALSAKPGVLPKLKVNKLKQERKSINCFPVLSYLLQEQ